MAQMIPFKGIRPSKERAAEIAALPYDVYNREEAKAVVEQNPGSFLAIDRPETQFDAQVGMYEDVVYEKARDLLRQWINEGRFVREETPCYYLYELTMEGRIQTGIVACASIDDYLGGVIKKHEDTRAEKEADRIRHVDCCNVQTGPIFLAYRSDRKLKELVRQVKQKEALYDFAAPDGVRHRVFLVDDPRDICTIYERFDGMQEIYIADGHHRAASAVKVGQLRREQHPGSQKNEAFQFFLSVLFPDDELMIMDYNRVVKDLAGLSEEEFLLEVKRRFNIIGVSGTPQKPNRKGCFGMYLNHVWYLCEIRPEDCSKDPVEGLDVSLLQKLLLEPVLGIVDPRTDERIDFVGGIRGLKELERRCAVDGKVAFAMYPTGIDELFAVADAGLLMPPKSTWFEPKLRSGLFLHDLNGKEEYAAVLSKARPR